MKDLLNQMMSFQSFSMMPADHYQAVRDQLRACLTSSDDHITCLLYLLDQRTDMGQQVHSKEPSSHYLVSNLYLMITLLYTELSVSRTALPDPLRQRLETVHDNLFRVIDNPGCSLAYRKDILAHHRQLGFSMKDKWLNAKDDQGRLSLFLIEWRGLGDQDSLGSLTGQSDIQRQQGVTDDMLVAALRQLIKQPSFELVMEQCLAYNVFDHILLQPWVWALDVDSREAFHAQLKELLQHVNTDHWPADTIKGWLQLWPEDRSFLSHNLSPDTVSMYWTHFFDNQESYRKWITTFVTDYLDRYKQDMNGDMHAIRYEVLSVSEWDMHWCEAVTAVYRAEGTNKEEIQGLIERCFPKQEMVGGLKPYHLDCLKETDTYGIWLGS